MQYNQGNSNYQEQLAAMQIASINNDMAQQQAQLPISKDRDFMQWLFNFKEEALAPLIHAWEGKIEMNPGDWQYPKDNKGNEVVSPIMNQRGIIWASSRIAKFVNSIHVVSNYDEEQMNWVMRKTGRYVFNGISRQYEEFDLRKINIPVVAWEIIFSIHAILLGARSDGFRKFFSLTHQESHNVNEVKTSPQKSEGWGLFKKKAMPSMAGMYGG
jgi:hypothetical protein